MDDDPESHLTLSPEPHVPIRQIVNLANGHLVRRKPNARKSVWTAELLREDAKRA